MSDLLTELFGSAIAGGLSGGIRANREEALREEKALAALLKEGKGYIPERLLPFVGGYTRYPPEESQPFPWAEGESPVAPGRKWTYAESAKAKGERERTEGYEKKLAEIPEHDFYNYLRETLEYGEGESEDLTKKIFELDELPWIKGEEPTAKQEMSKQEKILWDMFQRGDFTAENYKKNLSKFAQRRVEEMKLFPEVEEPEKGKELGATEQRIITILQKKPSGTAKHNVLWMNRKGFEVDAEKDEWKARTVDARDALEWLMGGGTSEETPKGKPETPTKPEYYGATSIAELEGALNSDPEITDSMKAKILEDARNAGLK